MVNDLKNKASGPFWVKSLILAAIFLLFIVAFMEVKANRELKLARIALSQSPKTAIRHYFQALNWYAPWGSSQVAADELKDLADRLKNEGRVDLAYEAYLRLRGALNAARSFYWPRPDLQSKANDFLANYLADKKISSMGGQGDKIRLYGYYLEIYEDKGNFSEFYGFLVVLSFLGWVFYFVKIIWAFFPLSSEKVPFRQKIYLEKILIIMFVACYVVWILAMKAA
ncbi:MAG: hypothetical protein LBI10_01625 [Deltaproteobacteria bacterium]|jgi:hypothetical protein|nr:hypothetical protein [Deltaproteobacteria bacterium]